LLPSFFFLTASLLVIGGGCPFLVAWFFITPLPPSCLQAPPFFFDFSLKRNAISLQPRQTSSFFFDCLWFLFTSFALLLEGDILLRLVFRPGFEGSSPGRKPSVSFLQKVLPEGELIPLPICRTPPPPPDSGANILQVSKKGSFFPLRRT